MTRTLTCVIVFAVAWLPVGVRAADSKTAQERRPEASTTPAAGQSRTVLPDGRILLAGGDAAGDVWIQDPRTGAATSVGRLSVPRAGHTATVLPDGSVIVLGGRDAGGTALSVAEILRPVSGSSPQVSSTQAPARWGHTATVLTDGRILIVGGRDSTSGAFDTALLWDPAEGRGSVVADALGSPRTSHQASLLSDGSVLISGGVDASGQPIDAAELYDSDQQQFLSAIVPADDGEPPQISGSMPAHGATDVAVNVRLSVRFNRPLLPETLNDHTVRLTEGAAVPISITPAEAGRLLFVTPTTKLAAGEAFTLTIQGAVDRDGHEIAGAISFVTADERRSRASRSDEEEWIPGAEHLRGNWRTGRPDSPWQKLPPLQAAPGVTALAGQVLGLDGRPLADVTLKLGESSAVSDRTGRFLLSAVADGQQHFVIDGRTASRPGHTYGVFIARAYVRPSVTNVLPFTIWLPRIDHGHAVRVSSPLVRDLVITTPRIPGLELHLPKGSMIRDHEGKIATEISITPVPVDRPPFPLPTGVEVPVYFTIQPGGGFIETPKTAWPEGARVVYPNFTNERPGSDFHFWNFDPEERGWHVYGLGAVNAAGSQVVPRPGAVIYRFTGTMINVPGLTPPGSGPFVGGGPRKGDPVDLATGLFVMEKTDLYLPDLLSLALTRTYRQNDSASRPFGIGSTHPFAMFLWSAQQYQEADLILPDGGRVHYVRTSAGTGYADAVFEHTSSPSSFQKSKIAWNGSGWDLTLKDGTVYVFGDTAPIQSIRDRYGNTIRYTWSSTNGYGHGTGNILKVTSPNGRFIEFTYDASNRVTQSKDNTGRTVGYQYDASGRLWKVTDPAGGVTEYTYDTSHRMLTLKDARNIVYLTNEYDANGRVSRQTQADSTSYQFAYTLDGSARVIQADVTNQRGYVERWTFNTSGYATSVVEAVGTPLQRTTTFTLQAGTNLVTSVIDPLNRRTDYGYDSKGNLASVTRLAGTPDVVTTTLTYESTFNQVASITDPLNHPTLFTYDSLGQLTGITDPLNHQSTFTYNSAGQVLTTTTALGHSTTFGYDLGDHVSVTDPLGRITTRHVDAAGRLIAVTDPSGQQTRYEYNLFNQLTKMVNPLGGETRFTYDANANLLSLTDSRNNATTYTYNNMDRVETRTDPLLRAETYLYDNNGNVRQVTDRKNQVTIYTYDALDRLTQTAYADSSTTNYTYDAGERLTQIADSTAGTITPGYDLLDRLTSETTPEGSISYTYDAADRRTTTTVVGQTAVSYSYDNSNRLTGLTQGSSAVTLAYDDADRRMSLTLPNGILVEYTYDNGSQLTALTYKLGANTLGTLTYSSDVAGRRTNIGGTWARTSLPAALASASYDNANRITTFGGTTFSYDLNGNLTSDGNSTYSWSARNQLGGLSGGASASFQYDGVGRRRRKTISGATTNFLYDGFNLVQELTSGGPPAANLLVGLGIDETFTRTDAAGTSTFLVDAIRSTIALTDGVGTVQTSYTYDPFGATTISGASSGNPLQFTGRESDGLGLYYYRARYYMPVTQRFVAEDPVGFGGGDANVYGYVGNDPANWIDPFGLVKCPTDDPTVTDPFGRRRPTGPHKGIDYRNRPGKNVYSTHDGVVLRIYSGSAGGNQIKILNYDASVSGYAHTAPLVQPGQAVNEGDPIGYSDGSGTTDPHLHYTYRRWPASPRENPRPHLPPPCGDNPAPDPPKPGQPTPRGGRPGGGGRKG
jgi:RHS repeat-associated protein